MDIQKLSDKKIAILGATGQVGRRLTSLLAQNNIPQENLTLISRTPTKVSYNTGSIQSEMIDRVSLGNFDVIFNAMPSEVLKQYMGDLWNNRCIIIDKSSAFRSEAPLIVPEVNGDAVLGHRLASSPNCVAIPLSLVLNAILPELQNITQVAVSTYQSVSGAGDKGMTALLDETKKSFFDPKVTPEHFEKQIAFNLLPKIGEFDQNYSTDEENKIESEVNRILGTKLPISVIAVRVPVLISHSIAVHIACKCKNLTAIAAALSQKGVNYVADGNYITPIEAAHEDDVYVSRLKRTSSGIAMWITCDNLGKGAALNALQIAAKMLEEVREDDTIMDEIKLAGVSVRTSNENEGNPELAKINPTLQKFFAEQSNIIHRKSPDKVFVTYTNYETDEHGEYTCFIGEEVTSFDDQTLETMVIPAQNYEKFTTARGKLPNVVIDTWQKIWQMTQDDLPRKYLADFEVYDNQNPDDAVVDVYVGVE